MGDEQKRQIRQIEEPMHIAQALESLVDIMLERYQSGGDPVTLDGILPLSTGRLYLDRLLGGGVRPATVTLFEAESAQAARPLLIDIAGHTDHRVLLAARRLHWETVGLRSAASRVSQQRIAQGTLEDSHWSKMNAVIRQLAERDLWMTETISPTALRSGVTQHEVEVLAVDDIGRLSHPCRALASLVAIAVELGVAVVATSAYLALEDLRGGDRLVRVGVHHDGGRSMLVRPDPIEMLRVEDVLVDHSTGLVN